MNILIQQLNTLKLSDIKAVLQQQVEQASLYFEKIFEERLSLLLTHEISGHEQRKI